jgi:tetratricopeptide (TPR) repeat protein
MRNALALVAALGLASPLLAQPPAGADEANRLYQAQDWAGAAKAYESLARQSENPMYRLRLGVSYVNLNRPADARSLLEPLGRTPGPFGAAALFQLARVEARVGDKENAFATLEKATAAGFAQTALLEGQADFAPLRDDPRFKEALTRADRNARPCVYRPEARQFDFWVGDWDVTNAGAPAGTSRIEKMVGDCVIFESWSGLNGYVGKSFNVYDPVKKRWQQTWVDITGRITEYYGEFRDGDLHYLSESVSTGPDGKTQRTLGRMIFYNLGKDQVRQLWEQSTDEGKTWTVAFDGLYTRKKSASASQ